MQLSSLVREDLIFPSMAGADAASVLRTFSERFVAAGLVKDVDELYSRLMEREELGSTGIGFGVAIPHCKLVGIERVLLAVGVLRAGIQFGAADGQPVRLFFVLVSPEAAPALHLKSLAAISRWIKADEHVPRILELSESSEVFQLLTSEGELDS